MIKRPIVIIGCVVVAVSAVFGLIAAAPTLAEFLYPTPPEPEPGLIDVRSVVPTNRILMDTLTRVSPDEKYTAFVTAKDKGFSDSTLWVTDNKGELTKIDFQIDEHTYYSAITWNKDSTKFAYLRIYPTAIVTVDVKKGFYRTVVLTKEKEQDKNILNPSITYQGLGHLKWNEDDTIEFENNLAVPAKIYTVDANTKEVKFKENVDEWLSESPSDISTVGRTSFFSQRDPAWQADPLGSCEDETIGKSGCAVSAIAMAFRNMGISDMTPTVLNQMLIDDNGYVNGCDVAWYKAASYFPGIVFKGAFPGNDFNHLDYELSKGHEVILGFNKVPYTSIQHWVVVRKKEDGKYFISDPWGYEQDETRTLDDLGGEFDHMIVYTKL
jgi:hypothetical protein